MNRLRVLQLGWEFPPLINGGLGIACLGLARALAKRVALTVVVPKSAPDADFAEVLNGALKADYWDVELMAKQINDFLTDDDLRAQVIEQAKLNIAACTWDAAAANVMKIYDELGS